MIHYHCVMSGLTGTVKEIERYVSKAWKEVTGDSYIVDVREAYTPSRLCNYLAKYLVKGFQVRESLEGLGFFRRYSSSRNWPKPELLRLRGTEMDRWVKMERTDYRLGDYGHSVLKRSENAYLMERVGDDLVEKLYSGQRLKSEVRKLERWMYGNKD